MIQNQTSNSKKNVLKIGTFNNLKLNSIPQLHIIIPVYNESKAILDILNRIHNTLKNQYKYKITVIDDGSSDDTYELLKNLDLQILLEKNKINLGKGRSLKKGISCTKKNELVIIMDGDGEHPPEEIPQIIKPILENTADFVIGSRFLKSRRFKGKTGSYLKNRKKFSKLRKIGNSLISLLIYIIYHKFISDSQSGFRAFAPGVISLYNPKYSRFEVETEMTIDFIKNKINIIEIPIDTGLSTRESHMNIIKDSLKIVFVIFEMKLNIRHKYLLRSIFRAFYTQENSLIKKQAKKSINKDFRFPSYLINKQNQNIISDKIFISPKVSIIIPCYNESYTILGTINAIKQIQLPNYEIIIIDDGSSDNSVEVISSCEEITIISHIRNEGYGKSLVDGILKSTGEIIITIDSDGQHDPRDIPTLCRPILENKADIVIGSRYAGKYFYYIPFINRLGEAFLEVMMRIIFRQTIKNNQGGFRAFHRRTFEVFKNIKFFGMAFTTELLMISFLKGYRVIERSINLHDRPIGKSRVKKIPLLLNLLHCLFYYGIKFFKNKYKITTRRKKTNS